MRLQGERYVPTTLLISSMELRRAVAANQIVQVYIVTPIHSFLSVDESVNNSSCLNNVSVVETIKKSVVENIEQKRLGRNPCFDKPVLPVCENKKTKADTEKTHKYAAILSSLLNEFRDVFPEDLPDGLPPYREVDHLIEVLPGSI